MITPKVVCVVWLDAKHEYGWQQGNALVDVDVPVCFSVGFLLEKNRVGVKVAQTWNELNHAQTITIPRGMIVKILEIGSLENEDE